MNREGNAAPEFGSLYGGRGWHDGNAAESVAPCIRRVYSPHQIMSDQPENLVLVYLRRIDGKIDRLTDDVQDLKHRVTSLEGQVAGLRSETASIRADMAAMSLRIDRIETRLDRIERRLDLVTSTTA
jgi:hypothetical protein